MSRRLLDVLLREPVIDSDTAAAGWGSLSAASYLCSPWSKSECTVHRFQPQSNVAREVTDALDAFATRAARRAD